MEVINESETPWLFELGGFLEDRGLESTDVTEIVMYVKEQATDADGSALVSKTYTGGDITWTADNDAVSVDINYDDYGSGKMEVGGTYYVYLGFAATGFTDRYLEARLRSHIVEIIQDGIRS